MQKRRRRLKTNYLNKKNNLLDFLSDIPNGQTVTFPDGTSYTGLGKSGDVSTSVQTDDAGISRMVAYDKRTGEATVTNIGQIGKTKSGGGDEVDIIEDNVVSKMSITLEASKDETGLYDPDIYKQLREELKKTQPQMLKSVDKRFLNPTNDLFSVDAIDRLRAEGIFADDRF